MYLFVRFPGCKHDGVAGLWEGRLLAGIQIAKDLSLIIKMRRCITCVYINLCEHVYVYEFALGVT